MEENDSSTNKPPSGERRDSSTTRIVTDAGIFSGIVTKRWRLPGKQELTVALRHSTLDGFRYLLVNNTEVKGSEGIFAYSIASWFSGQMPPPDCIAVNFDGGPKVTMQIVQASDRFQYTCSADGVPLEDMIRAKSEDSSTGGASDYIITIPLAEVVPDSEEGGIAFYTIYVLRRKDGVLTKCRRRFSHFYDLNNDLLSWTASSHLYDMLPSLPSRQWKLISDHLDDEFVQARRAELEIYMQRLLRVPRVTQSPEFLDFVNLWHPRRAKFSIISAAGTQVHTVPSKLASMHVKLLPGEYAQFFDTGPLGIVLRCDTPRDINAPVYIARLERRDSERMRVGDCLTRVNGREVKGQMSYGTIISTIRAFRARHSGMIPLALHFIRKEDGDESESKEGPDSNETSPKGVSSKQ